MSTQATRPTAMCVVCMEEEIVSIRIDRDPVCEDCVHGGIIPKFVDAWKHESNYPPAWGTLVLHPKHFAIFMEDGDEFLVAYEKKELEYNTPIAKRLYCGKCGEFCCEKDLRKLIRLCCLNCNALICEACGAVDENGQDHECEKPSDPFEGLVQGKDYQKCPNDECRMMIELKDGCNAMRCTSSSCNEEFCFVCGERAGHNSGHWKAGGKCPRFNQPGSQFAHFDRIEAVQEGEEPQVVDPVQAIIAEVERIDLADIDELVTILDRVTAFVRAAPLPPLPRRHDTITIQRLAAEADFNANLEVTPMGALMQHRQDQLRALSQVAETMIVDQAGQGIPAWLSVAVDVFIKLRLNLDMYIFRERLQAGLQAFQRRHMEMRELVFGQHFRELVQRFPVFFQVLATYQAVAEERFPVAMRFGWGEVVEWQAVVGGAAAEEDEEL